LRERFAEKKEKRVGGRGGKSAAAEGGITVFLSLILTCICALMGGLFESARTAGGGWYMQMALNSSLDSLMSLYHRDAFERYRLFLLEFEDREQLAEEMEPYCSAYLQAAPFYPLTDPVLEVKDPIRMTDGQGLYLEQEILDYMKFGIWNQETDPAVLSELSVSMREAKQFGEIAEAYQENGRKVLKLEESIDQIGDCLKRQKKALEDAKRALTHCNGSGFFAAAKRLKRELERIPSLTDIYEREAKKLKEELTASEEMMEKRRKDLTEKTEALAEQEMDAYRSYTDQEGERYQEVMEIKRLAEENGKILDEAVLKAEEVQEYIDSWEPDDEDDELDEEALWERVSAVLGRFRADGRFESSRVQDKKTMRVLEAISRLAGRDLLALCVPEGTKISNAVLDGSDLPSRFLREQKGSLQTDRETGRKSEEEKSYALSGTLPGNLAAALADMALFNEYISRYFTSFGSEKTGVLCYEQEYLLHGALSERENLKVSVNLLIGVREAINLLYLLSDSEKRAEAESLALAITGAVGIAPLVKVVTFFILTVWAFAESVEDVKGLLAGGTAALLKTKENWKLSLSGLVQSGEKVWENTSDKEEKNGLDYNGWLRLFFLIQDRVQLRFRMMDIMQNELRQKQPDFRMEQCAFRVEAEWTAEGALILVRRQAVREY